MLDFINDGRLFNALQSDLKKFDRMILIYDKQKSGLCFDFCSSDAVKMSQYNILILSTEKEHLHYDLTYHQITEGEMEKLYRLYHMYEFSDRFRVLSRERSFGTLFNYVDLGILDMEEIFRVFLH